MCVNSFDWQMKKMYTSFSQFLRNPSPSIFFFILLLIDEEEMQSELSTDSGRCH
jgi:hypothetical protein